MTGERKALLLAAHHFADPTLRPLSAPVKDIERLRLTLEDAEIGGFKVRTIANEPAHIVRRAITNFFLQAEADDFLLLFISTHGLKDGFGHLYFAATDTIVSELQATTVEAELIHRVSSGCRAKLQLLIFDSCFSGAFGKHWQAKDGGNIASDDILGTLRNNFSADIARGVVVLTASTSIQYSFEAACNEDNEQVSVFTKHLIDGISSGAADLNGDGIVSEDELYRYAFSHTRAEQPNQTPQRWVIGAVGDIPVAHARIRPGRLPVEVKQNLRSQFAQIRIGVIQVLKDMLISADGELRQSIRGELEQLLLDENTEVRAAARTLFDEINEFSKTEDCLSAGPAPPADTSESTPFIPVSVHDFILTASHPDIDAEPIPVQCDVKRPSKPGEQVSTSTSAEEVSDVPASLPLTNNVPSDNDAVNDLALSEEKRSTASHRAVDQVQADDLPAAQRNRERAAPSLLSSSPPPEQSEAKETRAAFPKGISKTVKTIMSLGALSFALYFFMHKYERDNSTSTDRPEVITRAISGNKSTETYNDYDHLTAASKTQLDEITEKIKTISLTQIDISALSSQREIPPEDRRFLQNRAETIKKFLVMRGNPPKKIRVHVISQPDLSESFNRSVSLKITGNRPRSDGRYDQVRMSLPLTYR